MRGVAVAYEGARDVVLLGAGFSRAVSSNMPLLWDLGEQVMRELGKDPAELGKFGGNLEQWLSFLSIEQPWLTDSENLRNRATFREASLAVRECIKRAEGLTLPAGLPGWLGRLVWKWCQEEAVVATFNYDLLLERTASAYDLTRAWSDLYGIYLTQRTPPGSYYMLSADEPPGRIFTLFKLHGSVNWRYGGPDAPSTEPVILTDTDMRWPLDGPVWPQAPRTGRHAALYSDVVPMVVPPTGTKAPYYGNRALKSQWENAFRLLANARSVTIMGYSFPATDLVSRQFLASANPDCTITVVNTTSGVARDVESLLPGRNVRVFDGDRPILDFVDGECGDLLEWNVARHENVFTPALRLNGNMFEPPGGWRRYSDPGGPGMELQDTMDARWPGARLSGSVCFSLPQDGYSFAWNAAYWPR